MSDSDAVEDIRQRKRERLRERAGPDGTLADDPDGDEPDAVGESTPTEPVHVESEAQFADLTGEGVVLADFYADWCGPCKQLEPIVEAVAANTQATVLKVDVDRHQSLAGQYGVRGVPTMVLFSDGEAVERVVGVRGEDQLTSLVRSHA
jgi:thioredoxin 1